MKRRRLDSVEEDDENKDKSKDEENEGDENACAENNDEDAGSDNDDENKDKSKDEENEGEEENDETAESEEDVQKRKLTKKQSKLVVDTYVAHNGTWSKIMAVKQIKALGRTEAQLRAHINYQRMKKNQKKTGKNGDRHRNEILKCIKKTPNSKGYTFEKPKKSGQANIQKMNEIERILEEFDSKATTDGVTKSSDVTDFNEVVQQKKSSAMIRNSRLHEKAQEKRNIVEIARQQVAIDEDTKSLQQIATFALLKIVKELSAPAQSSVQTLTNLSVQTPVQTLIQSPNQTSEETPHQIQPQQALDKTEKLQENVNLLSEKLLAMENNMSKIMELMQQLVKNK